MIFSFIKKIFNNQSLKFYFWFPLFFYFCLFFNFNNKTLFLALFLLILVFWIKLKKLDEALFLVFLISLPLTIGKTYTFTLIAPEKISRLSENPAGYVMQFIFSSSNMVAVFMLVSLLIKKRCMKFSKEIILLLILILSSFIANLNSINPNLSFLYFLQLLQLPLVFIYSKYLVSWNKEGKQKFTYILVSQIIFESWWVFLQFVRGGPLGHSLESMHSVVPFGRGADESFWQFRPTGTFDHANSMAEFLVPRLALAFALFYRKKEKNINYYWVAFIMGVLALLISLGRSAWASFLLSVLLIAFYLEKKVKLSLNKIFIRRAIIAFFLFLFIAPFTFWPRIKSSLNIFATGAGFNTRYKLTSEVMQVLAQNPLFGVGLGMGVPETFYNNPKGIMFYFPTPVHNSYLLFWLETGFFFLISFILLIIFAFKNAWYKEKKECFFIGIFFGMIGMLFNAFFQPFIANINLLFIILGFFFNEKNKL